MTYKKIYVFEHTDKTPTGLELKIGHNARVCGEMSDGTKVGEFDEMEEDGLYIAMRKGGTLYLVRE